MTLPIAAMCLVVLVNGEVDYCKCARHVWSKRMVELTRAVDIDFAGHVVFGGAYFTLADFDPSEGSDWRTPTPGARGDEGDIFLTKFLTDGSYAWTYAVGGVGHDSLGKIATGKSGEVFAVGSFQDLVDFDLGPNVDVGAAWLGEGTFRNAFLVKLDAAGRYQWVRTFRPVGPSSASAGALAIGPKEEIVFTGTFGGTLDFDSGGPGNIISDNATGMYAVKLDSNGTHMWAATFGGPAASAPAHVAVDSSGNIYISGKFRGRVDLDPGPGVRYHTAVDILDNFFAMKLGPDGSYRWSVSYPTWEGRMGVHPDGEVVLVSAHWPTAIDLDPTVGTDVRYPDGMFLVRLATDGSYLGGYTPDEAEPGGVPEDVAILPDGSIVVVGRFSGVVDFDADEGEGLAFCPRPSPYGECRFILRLARDATFQWIKSVDSTVNGFASSYRLAVGQEGSIIFSQITYEDIDLDPTCTENFLFEGPSPGKNQVFLTKLTCFTPGGDFDGDGRVDLFDAAAFQNCFEGQGATTCNPGCDEFDLAPDNAIDLADFARLIDLRTGP